MSPRGRAGRSRVIGSRRPRRRFRGAVYLLLALAFLAGAVVGAAHLLTGRSTLARSVAWMESDIGDLERFPARPILRAGPAWPLPSAGEDRDLPAAVPDGTLTGVGLDRFLEDHATRAFLVVHGGRVIYERYFNGGSPTRIETSFSMAKSFTSTLVGIAVDEKAIESVEDPVTRYVPELARRDKRFERIRIRHLLTMSSGLAYEEEGRPWSDDAVTYYGTDLREVALDGARIARPPGEQWHYNNFNPLLLGLVLERATDLPVAEYMTRKLWQPLGAEEDASWSLDSSASGFEKMESGVNARARDFARFGRLMLEEGRGDRGRIVSREWVRQATSPGGLGSPVDFYGALWWVDPQAGAARNPFYARGKFGQVIAVVPDEDLVLVRLGSDDAGVDWAEMLMDLAQRVRTDP